MKLFLDECLSSDLVHRAVDRSHAETTSVVFRSLAGTQDLHLVPIVVAGDYTLVTRNAIDFRGAAGVPGEKGLYRNVELHPGLIWTCNGFVPVTYLFMPRWLRMRAG